MGLKSVVLHFHVSRCLFSLCVSLKGSDCGLLHTLSVSRGERTAGEKGARENVHSPQNAALQVNTRVHLLSLCALCVHVIVL